MNEGKAINPVMYQKLAQAGLVSRNQRLERLQNRLDGKRRYLAHLERRANNPRCPTRVKEELAPRIRKMEREIESLEIKIDEIARGGGR